MSRKTFSGPEKLVQNRTDRIASRLPAIVRNDRAKPFVLSQSLAGFSVAGQAKIIKTCRFCTAEGNWKKKKINLF